MGRLRSRGKQDISMLSKSGVDVSLFVHAHSYSTASICFLIDVSAFDLALFDLVLLQFLSSSISSVL